MALPYDMIPARLDSLLVMTPDGTRKRSLTAYLYSDNIRTPFNIQILDGPIIQNPNSHGITWMNGRVCTITVSSAATPLATDRMASWSQNERIFITYMHEFKHVVKSGARERLIRPDSSVPTNPLAHQNHMPAFEQELYTRFEFSIFHPTLSSPKVNWIDNYIRFFGSTTGRYNGRGQEYCELIYSRVLKDINKLSDGFNYKKHGSVSRRIVKSVKSDYKDLMSEVDRFSLIL